MYYSLDRPGPLGASHLVIKMETKMRELLPCIGANVKFLHVEVLQQRVGKDVYG